MSEPRFYCPQLAPGLVTLDQAESQHALRSLRLRPGDQAVLFDGNGRIAHGVLQASRAAAAPAGRRRTVRGRLTASFAVERVLCEPPPGRTLTLIVAGCKGPRLTWMIEKLTELGVTTIVLAEFERSVVHPQAAHAARLRRTALEAAKQSRRAWLPQIECAATLDAALAGRRSGRLLVAHPGDEALPLATRLHAQTLTDEHVTAVVGPEGGLSDAELRALGQAGAELVRLAPTILRVETAALAVAANWAACVPM